MKWRIIIIVLVAVLVAAYVRTGLLGDCIGIGGFVWFALIPFLDRKRVRVRWATFCIVFCGLLGAVTTIVSLLRHAAIIVVSSDTSHIIAHYRAVVWGFLLGIMFVLMVSGQLLGTIRDEKLINQNPTA